MDKFIQVEPEHVTELSQTMQKEDVDSVLAIAGMDPLESIEHSLRNSVEAHAWVSDGDVGCIYGISSTDLLSPVACAWALCSDKVVEKPIPFLKESKRWIGRSIENYGRLVNAVDARHTRSIKWLRWLGFTIYPPQPLGLNGEMFHINEIRK